MCRKTLNLRSNGLPGCATTFLFGFALLFTIMRPHVKLRDHPEKSVLSIVQNHAVLSVWNFGIYILFGFLLLIMTIVLHHKLHYHGMLMMQEAAAIAQKPAVQGEA